MTPEIIELDDRVFEVAFEERPGAAAGNVRGVWTLRVLSGPGLTWAEAARVMACALSECVRRGLTVHRFGMAEDKTP